MVEWSRRQAEKLPEFYGLPKLQRACRHPSHCCSPFRPNNCLLCLAWQGVTTCRSAPSGLPVRLQRTHPSAAWHEATTQLRLPYLRRCVHVPFDDSSAYTRRHDVRCSLCLRQPAASLAQLCSRDCSSASPTSPSRSTVVSTFNVLGTNSAPPLANCYLASIEAAFANDPSIIIYKRFIDDGFAIVDNMETANRILDTLRSSGLQFTSSISTSSAIFLDLELFIPPDFIFSRHAGFRTHRQAPLWLCAFCIYTTRNTKCKNAKCNNSTIQNFNTATMQIKIH